MRHRQDRQTAKRPCPVCQGRYFHPVTVTTLEQKVDLSLCKHCGHEFINPLPDSQTAIEIYYQTTQPDDAHRYMEDPSRAPDFLVNQRYLKQLFPQGKTLLDFGCGKGQFCQLAQQNGFQAYGFDLSSDLVQIGKNRGLDLHTGDFKTFIRNYGPFDFIHSDQVFEHLVDPKNTLQELQKALVPSGVLCISVPLRDSFLHEYRFMEHLSYFSENSLKTLLTQAQFTILHTRKGIPLIRRYFRLFHKIPPRLWISFWERLTSVCGLDGWSLVLFARLAKE